MKLCIDPFEIEPRNVTAESLTLAWWYDSQPAIRRLWGVRESERLRVIIAVEPTHDNDDVYPAWLANFDAWTTELCQRIGQTVELELIHESRCGGVEIEAGSIIIADLYWRDATLNRFNEVL